MTRSGIQILKILPKTDCGECGLPRCLAFAMGIASGKVDVKMCPYIEADTVKILNNEFKETRKHYLKEEERHNLLGKSVDDFKLKKSENWFPLNEMENTYWTFWNSFAGCDQHSIILILFFSMENKIINELSFNILKPDNHFSDNLIPLLKENIRNIYQDRTCQITSDIRDKVTKLVSAILINTEEG